MPSSREREIVRAIPRGRKGERGPVPRQQWDGPQVSFENPDGSYGPKINLLGPEGPAGDAQNFRNRAYAMASHISNGLPFFRTGGYTNPGDEGDASYALMDAPPEIADERHVHEQNGQWYQRVGAINVMQFGCKTGDRSFASNDRLIQLAIDAGSTLGKNVFVPAGEYTIFPNTTLVTEARSEFSCFLIRSGMHLILEPGAIFRLADHCSTDASPKPCNMFGSNQVTSNWSITGGGTLDMNGLNNPISPLRDEILLDDEGAPTGIRNYQNGFNFAHVVVSGTPGGVAARASRVLIDNINMINTAGTNCIVMGQSNTLGTVLGDGWRINNCRFDNNGRDTIDCSVIYGWANNVKITSCTFTADVMWGTVGQTGMRVAIEIHGAGHLVLGNEINNAYRGLWVCSNYTSPGSGNVVAFNDITVCGIGIDFFREHAGETPITDILLQTNKIEITDDPAIGLNLKVGINVGCSYGVSNVLISGNTGVKDGAVIGSAFIQVTPQTIAGQTHTNIMFENNQARGFTIGGLIATNATNGLGVIEFVNNRFTDLLIGGVFGVAIGIDGSRIVSEVLSLRITGNSIKDQRGTQQIDYGILLNGPINSLLVQGNDYYRIKNNANYVEQTVSIAHRRGDYDDISFTPVWKAGASTISVGNGGIGAYFTQRGDKVTVNARLAVGSTTSFGAGGVLSLDLPFATTSATMEFLGSARIKDASAGTFTQLLAEIDATAGIITLQATGIANASNIVPVALASGDIVSLQIDYKKAA